MPKERYFVTSYCNRAHRLSDGKPVEHNCYILDPAKLQAEALGDAVDGDIVKSPRQEMMKGVRLL